MAWTDHRAAAARVSILSNSVLVVLKLAVGLAMGSVSVLSEAIHSGLDLLAAIIAFLSVRAAGKPADERHPFGHGKLENVAGTVEALLIALAAGWIILEAVGRFRGGGEPALLLPGIAVMAVAVLVNALVSRHLFRVARATESVALEADALHLRTDVWTSLGVLAGLALMRLTGWAWLDPAVALAVALLIIWAALELTREAFLPLVDVSLPAREEEQVLAIINAHADDYLEFHKVRTRRAGSERHIDLHLVFPKDQPLETVHQLCHEISGEIERSLPRAHVLIHAEPCSNTRNDCAGCRGTAREDFQGRGRNGETGGG